MANHIDVVTLLREARGTVQLASRSVLNEPAPDWERPDWEQVLAELTRLDTAYDRLIRNFGRRYLSKVTGKRVTSARSALLEYLRVHLGTRVTKEQMRVIAGIDEWPRRVRELRVEMGWPIQVTPGVHSTYYLSDIRPDPAAKKRWQELNRIRRMKTTPQDRILTLMRSRIGSPVDIEQIEYVAKSPAWKDELLKLRTEFGHRLSAPADRPELENQYLLESDDLLPDPDEWTIPEELRERVLEADSRACTSCGWEQDSTDDRWLEVHRRSPGVDIKDFASLCNVCHDRFHEAGARQVQIRLNRKSSVRAADWKAFFETEVSADLRPDEAGREIQRLLLPAVRIAGEELPHIREINALRENALWHNRVSRLLPVLQKRFGVTWYRKTGIALRPPLQGKPGDGFEQLTKYLIRLLTGRDAQTHVPLESVFPGKRFTDVRQIDVMVAGPGRVFLSLKWSLRGDRTHQVQLEAKSLKAIEKNLFFAVVTNEYDLSRLKPLLDDPNVSAVYHADRAGVETMWKPELDSLEPLTGLRDITELFRELSRG